MKKNKTIVGAVLALVLIVFFAGFTAVGCGQAKAEHKQLYHCPMHTYYITDKPGVCPICGMKLVPIEEGGGAQGTGGGEMGTSGGMANMPGMEMSEKDNTLPAGRAGITISPEYQQLIGVKTGTAEIRELGKTVSAVGEVAYDPEFYYTQQQYISAYKSLRQAEASGDSEGVQSAKQGMESAKNRMELMGLNDSQIEALQGKSAPDKSLLITQGGKTIWVYAQVYQNDLSYVKRGSKAEITASSINGVLEGRVVAIDTALNPETRSVRVRILAQNVTGTLRPEMYVDVKIISPAGKFLSIPEEAVLDTGSRQLVFVDKGNGHFEPRTVVLGQKIGGYYIVNTGINEGEAIVTSANFLIDSESQLEAATSSMSNMPGMDMGQGKKK